MTFVFPGYLQRQRDLNDPQYMLNLLDEDLKTLLAEKDKANGMNDNDIDVINKGINTENDLQHNAAEEKSHLNDLDKTNPSAIIQQKKINWKWTTFRPQDNAHRLIVETLCSYKKNWKHVFRFHTDLQSDKKNVQNSVTDIDTEQNISNCHARDIIPKKNYSILHDFFQTIKKIVHKLN